MKPRKRGAVKGGGRPTKYRAEFAEQAYKLCLLGATDLKLADFFGVTEQTLHNWRKNHQRFLESITRGKEIADAEIAEALFHRAKGYSHPEDDIRTLAGPNGAGAEIVITPTVKHYPPDTSAASLWLRNRQPKLWRDKQEVEHSGSMTLEQLVKASMGPPADGSSS
jgi:transposase-like protein